MVRLMARVLGAMVLLTGCASIAAYQAESAKYQAMADQATRALGGGEVSIRVIAGTSGDAGSETCGLGAINLGHDGADTEWLLAHELGHHISAHCGSGLINEEEANAAAVRALQVWGSTEEQALRRTANHLLVLQRCCGTHPLRGHSYCAETADLITRYPQYRPKDAAKVNTICPGVWHP